MTLRERIEGIWPEEADIPGEFRLPGRIDQQEYLVDGEIRSWDGPREEVLSPVCTRTEKGPVQRSLGSYPLLTEKEALGALDAARRAYDDGRGLWPTLSVEERIRHIEALAVRLGQEMAEIVKLLMWEVGKSYEDCQQEFARTMAHIRGTVDALRDLDRISSGIEVEQGIMAQIRRAPLGVVLCMGPFNYPLNEAFAMLVPALVMGNTVIFKPPRYGVLFYRPLLKAFQECLPHGVVNTVYGDGPTVIGPIMSSGRVDVLAFIGSSRVADLLRRQHPRPHRLRCVLGLEAKNAAVVLRDADLENAVGECVRGSLCFNGQRCTALKIVFVHSRVAGPFLDRFCEAVRRLPVGMPWDRGVAITPLPEYGKTAHLLSLVREAESFGARIVNEGGATADRTLFYPAVLYPVDPRARVYREEQFGPVVPVVPFETQEEPMRYIIESDYGQQVSIFGRDHRAMAPLIKPLLNQVCRVNLNTQCQRGPDTFPFTGRKDSAEGTMSVSDALRAFSIRTVVAARDTPFNRELFARILRERQPCPAHADPVF